MSKQKEEKDVVVVCTTCRSDQLESYVRRNVFAQVGESIPCQYCGGPCIITYAEHRDIAIEQHERNIRP